MDGHGQARRADRSLVRVAGREMMNTGWIIGASALKAGLGAVTIRRWNGDQDD